MSHSRLGILLCLLALAEAHRVSTWRKQHISDASNSSEKLKYLEYAPPVGCGKDSELAAIVDTCSSCCCVNSGSSSCMDPELCEGTCAERQWHPTLSELQAEKSRREDTDGYESLSELLMETESEASLASGCPAWLMAGMLTGGIPCTGISMCARKRGFAGGWGTFLVMRLGSQKEGQQHAGALRAWHWDPKYSASPYLHMMKRIGIHAATAGTHGLEMDGSQDCWDDDVRSIRGTCCVESPMDRWALFIKKLSSSRSCEFDPEKHCLDTKKSRRKFTYVITAPQNSVDIELRVARMDADVFANVPGLNILHDLQSKHAFLAQYQDWVLYAGEMWLQPKVSGGKTGGDIDLSDIVLVIDNNSGTFSPGADRDTRRGVQELFQIALEIPEDRVQVCNGPFTLGGYWEPTDDACPNNPEFYPDVEVPSDSAAGRQLAAWKHSIARPVMSQQFRKVIDEDIQKLKNPYVYPAEKRDIEEHSKAVKEAKVRIFPCDLLADGSCGEGCMCWSECKGVCSEVSKLENGYEFQALRYWRTRGKSNAYADTCSMLTGYRRLCMASPSA